MATIVTDSSLAKEKQDALIADTDRVYSDIGILKSVDRVCTSVIL